MIILVHPERLGILMQESRMLVGGDYMHDHTPIHIDPNLPLEDSEGQPILCFRISAKELHYWRDEPIPLKGVR